MKNKWKTSNLIKPTHIYTRITTTKSTEIPQTNFFNSTPSYHQCSIIIFYSLLFPKNTNVSLPLSYRNSFVSPIHTFHPSCSILLNPQSPVVGRSSRCRHQLALIHKFKTRVYSLSSQYIAAYIKNSPDLPTPSNLYVYLFCTYQNPNYIFCNDI